MSWRELTRDEILNKWKMKNTDSCEPNVAISYCPNCEHGIDIGNNLFGWGEYPRNNYRAAYKPHSHHGLILECDKCFTKAIYHCDIEQIFHLLENREYRLSRDHTPKDWEDGEVKRIHVHKNSDGKIFAHQAFPKHVWVDKENWDYVSEYISWRLIGYSGLQGEHDWTLKQLNAYRLG